MAATLLPRQVWALPTPTETDIAHCTAFSLPSDGVLVLNATQTITLTEHAVFQPECNLSATLSANSSLPFQPRDPFYSSILPQLFVIGAMLVIAWSLVIILLITPRTSLVIGAGGGIIGGRGIIGGASGGSAIIGVGGRPWLQKVAATTVGISLIIATINTFRVVEDQYNDGKLDSTSLALEVSGSTELKVIRVISDTFLWLAQVQTLIRLFPRHREKVIIKWAGFALITLDELFSILNSFLARPDPISLRPRRFTEAIPALSYLFDLALSLLYAAWVVYYSLEKRRFAFWHQKMHNIIIVAAISLIAVSIPIVFFSIDVAKPSFAGWGDYVRWVGAAAASVVVWEWVERIEALEREERKDGILGREIFEDDEVPTTSSSDVHWPRSRRRPGSGDSDDGEKGLSRVSSQNIMSRVRARRHRPPPRRTNSSQHKSSPGTTIPTAADSNTTSTSTSNNSASQTNPNAPPPAISPVSRSDTTSAASTVYAIIHHPASTSTSPAQEHAPPPTHSQQPPLPVQSQYDASNEPEPIRPLRPSVFHNVPNPFKRRRHSPPREVSLSAVDQQGEPSVARTTKERSTKELFTKGFRRTKNIPADELPVVHVPAQPRGKVWSPPISDSGGADAVETEKQTDNARTNRGQITTNSSSPDSISSRLAESQTQTAHTSSQTPSAPPPSSSPPQASAPPASDLAADSSNPFTLPFELLTKPPFQSQSTSNQSPSHPPLTSPASHAIDFAHRRGEEGDTQG